ncbi:MAG TPA: PspC domain-containing protein [Solirubrobacteraceae bacterium]|nr:PspC domain-containing protein [Solirubrobacteraceae bacterium]
MATRPAPVLRRDTEHRILGGVCSGLARHIGVDPLIVRVLFITAATAGGVGVAVYLLAWVFVPAGDAPAQPVRLRTSRGMIEVTLGVALLALSVLLTFRAFGLLFSDVIVWPLVLVAAGGALLWRQLMGRGPVVVDRTGDTARTWYAGELERARALREAARPASANERAAVVSRTSLGVALVIAAGLVFLSATGALSAARDVVLSVLVVAVVLAVIFAPLVLRLVRSLTAERAERIRSQEWAEMAAHLHDSVLQTLALVQQRADDPRAVAALARRQERELRAWLTRRVDAGPLRLARALEVAAGEVERDHGVAVEVVAVGDADLDARGEALVAAAREAMVNAAKFGGGSTVDVYAEALDGEIQVYVRDRGPGFAPDDVPADRRGVRESIVGRMARHGGRAEIHSAPGAGTEVELTMPRDGP